jgi:uncharacterized YccA/Bax inhibitor family protein
VEATRPIAWGAAIRWLRWVPTIAGMIAYDALAGTQGWIGALAVTVDIALICVLLHSLLTKEIDYERPKITWLEGLFVGSLTCSLLGMQVAFVDPGGVTGRATAVLTALALGTLLAEMVEARRGLEAGNLRSTRPPGPARIFVAS